MKSSYWNTVLILVTLTKFGSQNVIQGSQDPFLYDNTLELDPKTISRNVTPEIKRFSGRSICNPPATAGMGQFIIGYGSLMQTASKERTSPNTGENLPVKIYGYSRGWNCKGTSVSLSTTYLGALVNPQKSFNAAVYKLPNAAALQDYDTRESYYCREEVPVNKIEILTDNKRLAAGQYWMYVTKPEFTEKPSREYPMVQSYVDTFLSGCLELEEKFKIANFSKDCVNSTEGWDSPWVNDRIFPRRPFIHEPMAGEIDSLLNTMVPKAYRSIRIE